MKLLTTDNAKTVKGEKKGYRTAILYLAPHKLSGRNVCPSASPGCIAVCLNTAGHGAFSTVQAARIKKTKAFTADPKAFVAQLVKDIEAFEKHCKKNDLIPCVRLDGTSDVDWSNPKLAVPQKFPNIQFYGYTKRVKRALDWANGLKPANEHLVFSRSETNQAECEQVAKAGGNIAVVFSNKNYPKTYLGLPVVDGDDTDLRFLDPKGSVVALYAKGRAKKDTTTGFVVQV